MKIISFSLYGSDKRYTYNAIINCKIAELLFPDWKCRFYIDDTVPFEIIQTLYSLDNVQVSYQGSIKKHRLKHPMYWRMLAVVESSDDIILVRDCDSWLSQRDVIMVNEWLNTNKDFHIIRDHCHHRSPIMGGTWGCRNNFLKTQLIQLLYEYQKNKTYDELSNDQVFLNAYIYPLIKDNYCVHGRFEQYPMPNEEHALNTPKINEYNDIEHVDFPFRTICNINGQGHCNDCNNIHLGYVGSIIRYRTENVNTKVEELISNRNNNKMIISFSLYNKRPKDVVNAIFNCFLAPKVYPGWLCRFYYDNTIPTDILELLKTFRYVELIEMQPHRASEAMLWRFLPASDPTVKAMISRDADSWVSTREYKMVENWLFSDKNFHIIRDHCYHSKKIMGGVWGVRNRILPQMKELVDEFSKNDTYDQGFLATQIYPLIENTLYVNDPHTPENHVVLRDQYHTDSSNGIPEYYSDDEPVEGLSFSKVHSLNKFECWHCKKTHETFVGAILEHMTQESLNYLKQYCIEKNIIFTTMNL